MRIAYARVSTGDQSLDLQIDALKRAGYDKLFTDHGVSGVADQRPGLEEALAALSPGDTFMVWRLDRLARSMRDLSDTVWALHRDGVKFQSLCEHVDVGSAFGEFVLHIMSAMAQFERALIVERTKSGMAAAKARGVKFGRPSTVTDDMLQDAVGLISQGSNVTDAATSVGTSKSTLYRRLQHAD